MAYHPLTVEEAIGIAGISLLTSLTHAIAWQTGRASRRKFPACVYLWRPEHWVGSVGFCVGAPVLFAYALAALHDHTLEHWSIHAEALRLLPHYLSAGLCVVVGYTINPEP